MTRKSLSHSVITLLWLFNCVESFATTTTEVPPPALIKPIAETLYKNRTYHFSFAIPPGWEKQSGHASTDNVFFMQLPISNSCSFQFNIVSMPATFPAEVAATTSLATAYHERRLNKLLSAKRRDTWIKEKVKDKTKTKDKDKIILLTRGWEIIEKPQKQKQQRIIYQVYDRENRYFNFIAAASSENFLNCSAELHKIMDSISFDAN